MLTVRLQALGCGPAAYQFASVGIAPCALNTSAPVGTRFSLTFLVFDNGVPPLSSSVSRTVLITAPCPLGQFYCDGTCLQISCAASAALAAAAVTPVITLTSITAGAFGGTSGGSAGVAYGTMPGFSLTPCSSYSELSRPAVCLADCIWCHNHDRDCVCAIMVVFVPVELILRILLVCLLLKSHVCDMFCALSRWHPHGWPPSPSLRESHPVQIFLLLSQACISGC